MSKILVSLFSFSGKKKGGLFELFTYFEEKKYECIFLTLAPIPDLENQILINFDRIEYLHLFEELEQDSRFLNFDHSKWVARIQAKLALDEKSQLLQDRLLAKVSASFCSHDQSSVALIGYKLIFSYSYSILALLAPDLFLSWNPNHYLTGIAYDIAESLGIRVGAIENGYLPNTLLIDPKGIAGASYLRDFKLQELIGSESERYLKIGYQVFDHYKGDNFSLYKQPKLSKYVEWHQELLDKPKIVCFGITEADTGCIPVNTQERVLNLPFHQSSYDMALDVARNNSGITIYKAHPHSLSSSAVSMPELDFHVSDADPIDLIGWADVVVCIGSKLEFSCFYLGKPLVLYGSGLLWNKNCAYEVHHPDELANILTSAFRLKLSLERKQSFIQYLGYLTCCYLYNLDLDCSVSFFRNPKEFLDDFTKSFSLNDGSDSSTDLIRNKFLIALLNGFDKPSKTKRRFSIRSVLRVKSLLKKLVAR